MYTGRAKATCPEICRPSDVIHQAVHTCQAGVAQCRKLSVPNGERKLTRRLSLSDSKLITEQPERHGELKVQPSPAYVARMLPGSCGALGPVPARNRHGDGGWEPLGKARAVSACTNH